MCGTCGCGQPELITIRKPGEQYKYNPTNHYHDDDHEQNHDHPHDDHSRNRELSLELDIMHKNDLLAERNRGYFEAKKIFAVNLVSSPGSGKTSILERTIKESAGKTSLYIIEGDQQTMLDAERIGKAGAPVVQVNTGNGCHLDAAMISQAVKRLDIPDSSTLMIENVGNLVCPALFDLGESKRVVIISVTEGEDKPLKYPNMFQTAQLCLINKSDLLPYVDFDSARCMEYALRVNPQLEFITLSARTGEGFDGWLQWLEKAI
jgi:hydrogenase nickel incorporation protein HypB